MTKGDKREMSQKNKRPKIITVTAFKGGTGKTTISYALAGKLAEKHKVLIIDVDGQGNMTNRCNLKKATENEISVYDLYRNIINGYRKPTPEEMINFAPIKELPKLDIIISSREMLGGARSFIHYARRTGKGTIEQICKLDFAMKDFIEENIDYFNQYDYIIFDTNPAKDIYTIGAYLASNAILIVTDTSDDAVKGTSDVCDLWDGERYALSVEYGLDIKDNIEGIIINNDDGLRKNNGKKAYERISNNEYINELLLKDRVPRSSAMIRSAEQRKPVNVLYAGKKLKDKSPEKRVLDAINGIINDLKERGVL